MLRCCKLQRASSAISSSFCYRSQSQCLSRTKLDSNLASRTHIRSLYGFPFRTGCRNMDNPVQARVRILMLRLCSTASAQLNCWRYLGKEQSVPCFVRSRLQVDLIRQCVRHASVSALESMESYLGCNQSTRRCHFHDFRSIIG